MSTTLPGVSVTIPGLNPQDTLGSAILNALNSMLGSGGGLTEASVQGTFPVPGGSAVTLLGMSSVSGSPIVGDISVSGILFEPTFVQDLVVKADGEPSAPGAVTVFGNGNDNQSIVSGQYTRFTFFTNGGSGTVNSGGGHNFFGTPTQASNSAWYFNATTGQNTVQADSGNNTISMGNGNNLIGVGGGTDSIISSGSDTILITGGAATIDVVPGGSDVVSASAPGSLYFVSESASPSTVWGNNTSGDFISGGTAPGGGGIFSGGSGGNNTLVSGFGRSTLVGGGNNDQLSLQGTGSDVAIAGPGNETVDASNFMGQDTIFTNMGTSVPAGGNNEVINGSSGSDTFWTNGNVNASITGNGGPFAQDAYNVVNNLGPQDITVTDWNSGDTLAFYNYGNGSGVTWGAVAGGFQTTLSDGSKITLLTTSSLDQSQISFK
jgi:hypothetical protein